MIYAIPPAIRITALGIRGVSGDWSRPRRRWGPRSDRSCRRCSCRSHDGRSSSRQSDDSVRALDGRHRRADRRQGPRRRRDERAELVPRARDPRRDRDRRDGDGTRPDHRGRRRPYGIRLAAISRRSSDAGSVALRSRRRPYRVAASRRRPNVRRLRRLLALDRPRLDSRPDPVGARLHSQSGTRSSSASRAGSATRSSGTGSSLCTTF